MKVSDMICVSYFHDLCLRQSPKLCRKLCRKVGAMEFGLDGRLHIVSPLAIFFYWAGWQQNFLKFLLVREKYYRVVKKRHKVNDTIILPPYIIESCGFQQNAPKEILYMTKVNISIQQLNILCYCRWQSNYAKTLLLSTLRSIKTCYFYFFNSSVKHWSILIILDMQH